MKRTVLSIAAVALLSSAVMAEDKPAAAPATQRAQQPAAPKAKLVCSDCNMEFKSAKEARQHMKEAHHKLGYCAKCNLAFATKKEEKEHMASAHPKAAKAPKSK